MKYQAFYCEENIWHLADAMRVRDPDRPAHVIFASNVNGTCAMWKQRAGDPVVWDYHVVLHAGGAIYDLDTRLGSPLPVEEWIAGTFPIAVPEKYAPSFRVIDAQRFVEVFASDRSHMRTEKGWKRPPPEWPLIGDGMNLMRFIDMKDPFEGTIVDLAGLRGVLY